MCSDQPAKPTVEKDVERPTDGDKVTLTCVNGSVVDTFYFKSHSQGLSHYDNTQNTYAIESATIDTDDIKYSCSVKVGQYIESEDSEQFHLKLVPKTPTLTLHYAYALTPQDAPAEVKVQTGLALNYSCFSNSSTSDR